MIMAGLPSAPDGRRVPPEGLARCPHANCRDGPFSPQSALWRRLRGPPSDPLSRGLALSAAFESTSPPCSNRRPAGLLQTLPPATAEALAATGRSGAVSLRINYVYLGPNRGSECGPSKDEMVGVVTAGGVERPLRASSSYFPSPADNAMIEQSNYDRIYQLSQAFAYWVARGF